MGGYYSGLNTSLLKALPTAKRVLEIGCAEGLLGSRYLQANPGARWIGVDIHPPSVEQAKKVLTAAHRIDVERESLECLEGGFDLIVLGDVLEHLKDSESLLRALRPLCEPGAQLLCCIPNMGHFSVLDRLLQADMSYDDEGLLDRTHVRFFTLSSAMKCLLDGGWLPKLVDRIDLVGKNDTANQQWLEASLAQGLTEEAACTSLFAFQFIFSCQLQEAQIPAKPSRLSVVLPIRNPRIARLNLLKSPGLRELACQIIPIEAGESAAHTLESARAKVQGDWILLASDELYLPSGSGVAINHALSRIPIQQRAQRLLGFAGMGLDSHSTPFDAGLLATPQALYNHPASATALSMEDCGVLIARDSLHRLDPEMGWEHWATELCLNALTNPSLQPGEVLRIPAFHNRIHTSPISQEEADASARRLLEKHSNNPALRLLRDALQAA